MKKKNSLLKWGIAVFLFLLLLFIGFWGYGIYSEIDSYEAKINVEWNAFESLINKRISFANDLREMVNDYVEEKPASVSKLISYKEELEETNYNVGILKDEDRFRKFDSLSSVFEQSLSRVLADMENYPDLKSTESFQQVKAKIISVNKQIVTQKEEINYLVYNYNKEVTEFPGSLVAGITDHKTKALFKL